MDLSYEVVASKQEDHKEHEEREYSPDRVEIGVCVWADLTLETLLAWLLVHIYIVVISVLPLPLDSLVPLRQPSSLLLLFGDWLLATPCAREQAADSLLLPLLPLISLLEPLLAVVLDVSVGPPYLDAVVEIHCCNVIIELVSSFDVVSEFFIYWVIAQVEELD